MNISHIDKSHLRLQQLLALSIGELDGIKIKLTKFVQLNTAYLAYLVLYNPCTYIYAGINNFLG